ncbi:FAD-binding oxidoreductase [Lichenibacterium minor]|uniref:FAD-binding oxidoreductase n=1 Tax=Lichenibacterium minor TaxID=2316528 RepID=UPI0024799465|nr:FAD-binding protein [Lichenibacterium minor]
MAPFDGPTPPWPPDRRHALFARRGVPVTPRGAATGNYGQAVPLHGGVLLDMTALKDIAWVRDGAVRCGPGLVMSELDAALAPHGLEQRMHPSTKRRAAVGGFVAGGSGGIGSIPYGGLRKLGNILAVRVITVEPEPRAIELRGDAAQKVDCAYTTPGMITALGMPLAPAWPWVDLIVAFDSFAGAMAAGHSKRPTEHIPGWSENPSFRTAMRSAASLYTDVKSRLRSMSAWQTPCSEAAVPLSTHFRCPAGSDPTVPSRASFRFLRSGRSNLDKIRSEIASLLMTSPPSRAV